MKNRVLSLLIAVVMLLAMLPQIALPATAAATASGTCGDNLTWTLENGTLTISGNGAMATNYYNRPWYSYIADITAVVIEDGVTTVGESTFSGYPNLESVTIADSVTEIGESAFIDCKKLKTVTIGNGATEIGDRVFRYCTNLETVTMGDHITAIGDAAFFSCKSLKTVTIPASVTTIGEAAFRYCCSLSGIWVDAGNPNYISDPSGVLFNKDKTQLLQAPGTLSGKYIIPDSVTTIAYAAFYLCADLEAVTIPDSVTTIEGNAFTECTGLQAVTIGNGVTSIESGAFEACTSLKNVTVPDSVTYLGDSAFSRCSGLKSATIGNGVTYLQNHTFYECTALEAVTLGGSITTLSSECGFYGCTSLKVVTIPESVTRIGYGAFSHCTELTTVLIPVSVTRIDDRAFNYTALTDVYYGGTAQQWAQIDISADNTLLTNATIHFNSPSIFGDVSKDGWQFPFAKYALERSLMAGKGTDAQGRIRFDPNSPITREEFVQILYNAEGKPAVTIANPFPDVAENGWYKNAVLWAKENNIANGGGDGNFGIGARITRQDLALILYKYATLKGGSLQAENGKINGFADGNKVTDYAKTAMDWAVTNGILSGKGVAGQPLSTFRLDPTGTATRAECAAMLKNFMTAFGL